jgi:SAM-dependent methyltransferase
MRKIRPDAKHPHWCFPLADPAWVPGKDARHMQPDDPVLGLEFDGASWALPWWIMKNHHLANLVLNGRPIMVALCEVCSTASAFDPVIDGRRHTFKLGGLFNGTIMPTDYETESLWSVYGEAIEGALKGRTLERLPLLQCTWREWLDLRPATLVPDGKDESREGHGEGNSPGSPYVGPDMGDLVATSDRRLPYYELVLGVRAAGAARCYPLSALADHGAALNDTLGGKDIVILSRPGSWLASAFLREVDGRALTFGCEGNVIIDRQTQSRWEISGAAVHGELKGRQLKYVNSGIEEFFLWSSFNPLTEIHGVDQPPPDRNVQGDHSAVFDVVPKPVYGALDRKWLKPGMRLLHAGCGSGVIAAYLAESGLDVTAVDTDAVVIAKAQRTFRGVVRLNFRRADLGAAMKIPRPFDAVLDFGHLLSLDTKRRAVYLDNLAAGTKRGARFMLLLRMAPAKLAQRTKQIRALFAKSFKLESTNAVQLPDASGTGLVSGAAFRLVRL